MEHPDGIIFLQYFAVHENEKAGPTPFCTLELSELTQQQVSDCLNQQYATDLKEWVEAIGKRLLEVFNRKVEDGDLGPKISNDIKFNGEFVYLFSVEEPEEEDLLTLEETRPIIHVPS